MRLFRLVLLGTAAVTLLVAAATAALLWLPMLDGARSVLASRAVAWLTGRPVDALAGVEIRLGRPVTIALEGLVLGDAGPAAWRGSLQAGEVRVGLEPWAWLGGDPPIAHVSARRVVVALAAGPAGAPHEPVRLSPFSVPLARLLTDDVSRRIDLAEVSITRPAAADGWPLDLVLDEVTSRQGDQPGTRAIALDGMLNGAALGIDAAFGAPDPVGVMDYTLEASMPGVALLTTSGTFAGDGTTLAGDVALDVASLGRLQQHLALVPRVEGAGRLSASIAGPVDALAARRLALELTLASGERLTLDGQITDLSAMAGIDLAATVDFARRDGGFWRPTEAFDLALERAHGRLAGGWTSLSIEQLIIESNVTTAAIEQIGPIVVGKVVHDDSGRLSLEGLGIEIRQDGRPALLLEGRVEDLLALEGVALAGRLDVDPWPFLADRTGPAALGRLAGMLALADRSGGLGIERLEAALTGNGPLSLRLGKMAAGGGDAPLEVTLAVEDLSALAEALGEPPLADGPVRLEATVDLVDRLHLAGRAWVGSSTFWIDLDQDIVGDAVMLDGRLKSPRLVLADVPRLAALAELWPDGGAVGRSASGPRETARLEVELDTEATIVGADDYVVGRFAGRLTARDGSVTIDPLALDYLGGRVHATLAVAAGTEPPAIALGASVRGLAFAALLRELGLRPVLETPLDAELDLDASGRDRDEIARTLTGRVELAMGEGRIGSRLVDLAAQDILSWLYTSGPDTRLVCADAVLDFADGVGTFEGLILKTPWVQLLGSGTVDLGSQQLDVAFTPRARGGRVLGTGTPFAVRGPLGAPRIEVGSAAGIAGRALVETLGMPVNALGAILGARGRSGGATCLFER